MPQEETIRFRSQFLYDQALHREYRRGRIYTNRRLIAVSIAVILLLMITAVIAFRIPSLARPFAVSCLIGCAIGVLPDLIRRIRNRNGDPLYRKMLEDSGGSPICLETVFTDDGIMLRNLCSGSVTRYDYCQIQMVFETENLLVSVISPQISIIADKRTLAVRPESLADFLLTRCGSVKKVRDITPGWLCSKALTLTNLCIILLSVILLTGTAGTASPHPITANTSYTEIAGVLEGLGITGCSDELISELEAIEAEYADYYSAARTSSDRVLNLLCWIGMGEYDDQTWEWTPCDGGVYWFDAEVFRLDTMYTDFLRGVAAASCGELVFTDIQEDTSQVNWEQGTGKQSVSFCWNGERYTLEADVMNDWFDLEVIADLQEILNTRDDGKQLYFAFDGGQGFLVFYRDRPWAADFQAVTGIHLTTDITLAGYLF